MYFRLVKVFFKENFSLKRILGTQSSKSKTKTILLSLLLLYALGSVLFSFGYLFFELGKIFHQINQLDTLLVYLFIYATFITVMFVILRSSGYLFHYKDYDFLGSLPIKNEEVVAAKISVMLIMIYITNYILSIPIMFSYFYHGGFSLLRLIMILVLLLFVPLIPLIICSFISLILTFLLSHFRISKIINVFLIFALLLGFMYLSFRYSFTSGEENPLVGQLGILESISRYIPTATIFYDAIQLPNFGWFSLFIIINIALIVGYVYLIRNLVDRTNQTKTKAKVRTIKNAKLKQRHMMQALVQKEVKTFFSINIYVLNSGLAPILFIIGGFASIYYHETLSSFFNQLPEEIGGFRLENVLLIGIGFLLSTVFTSAISLSLEGKNFWILQSLPIKAKTIMLSKWLFNVLLGAPFAIFLILSIAFSVGLSFITVLTLIIVTISFSMATSIIGSVINLYFPKFEFKNETEVVKQSIGGFLGMFSGLGLLLILGLSSSYLLNDLTLEIQLTIMSLFNLLIFYLLYLFIDKKAESLFMRF